MAEGERVLAAIDFSPQAEGVLEVAGRLALAVSAELTLLHVAAPEPDFVGYEVGPQSVRDDRAQTLDLERRQLHQMADDWRARGLSTRAFLFAGPTVEKILEQAEAHEASWIVLGTHGRSRLAKAFIGSVSRGVVESAPCPVVVVPPG